MNLTQSTSDRLRVAFIEPHLRRYGGIRRVIELANRLQGRGHEVTFLLPDDAEHVCTWMRCEAHIRSLREGLRAPYDVVVFNHEPQWHLLSLFQHRPARVFYALHYSRLYGKAGSWEAIRTPVELRLANSTWTADRIGEEVGDRPVVLLGGINREHFHPVPGARKRYPILTMGDTREWKGHGTVVEAAKRLQLPLETYSEKDLPQEAMAEEYAKAEVFVVGSRFEGFGQPGLEALACGVPLVTTDNGGCRDYAVHEETALVVPPDDPQATAQAISRLRRDPVLAERLVENGLALVEERFDWDRSAARLEQYLQQAVEATAGRPASEPALLYEPPEDPELSIVVLAWDQLPLTQACVESIRQHTDVPYELIIVDNGSAWEAANYASCAADVSVLNDHNRGFAAGLNQGLERARGRCIAFLNNDTVLPPAWASPLVAHTKDTAVGIVVPAITNARDPRIVRSEPGEVVEELLPFEAPPPAVMYVMDRETVRALGGWEEEYEIASGEDMDLCFKVWANDLSVVFDSRVLVEHVSKGTAGTKLENWRELWARNRKVFLEKWQDEDIDVPRLESCAPDVFERNLRTARAVAGWMERYFDVLNQVPVPGLGADPSIRVSYPLAHRPVRGLWRLLRSLIPTRLRRRLFVHVSGTYYRYFPERRAGSGAPG